MAPENYTLEELLICRMAKEFSGERIAASATILADISARLAKALYAPEIFLVAGGSHASVDAPVGSNFITGEWETGPRAALSMDWRELFELIAHGNLVIFMGPVQIDKAGNANISVLGPWETPKVQMIGSRGLPDDLWGNHTFLFHVSRHTRRSFVERIDFKCSIGYGEERRKLGLTSGKPKVVISDLGVFAWDLETGVFRIESLHPRVSFKDVQDNTAFALDDDPTAIYPVTPAPTEKELYWIREKIDPAGWRRTAAKDQPASLRELAAKEIEAMGLSSGTK
jgi:glutaconate CoA-transferase subunit B